jgi:peptidoglycan hydrolase-like protein with peptidoglycan-binding domain
MIFKALTAATLAVALATFPAKEASADVEELIGGLIVGGLIGAAIANGNNAANEPAAAPHPAATQPQAPVHAAIPATQLGRETQTALNYFGFNAGAVDGQVGPMTRGAIERYQAAMGYPVNGRAYMEYQNNELMQAYYWGLNGGSAQTGLYGQPLLMAYRSAQVAPQPAQPTNVAGPPAQTVIVAPPTAASITPVYPIQDTK